MKPALITAAFTSGALTLFTAAAGVGVNSAPGVAASGLALIMVGCTLLLRK